MDMPDEWVLGLHRWAGRIGNVLELWIFGSRAEGRATPESDVDVALVLIPPDGKHNWALGNYGAFQSEWQQQLESIVGRDVDLVVIEPGSDEDTHVRHTGRRLWPMP
jgi:predicted nucleotidyltransferase